MIRISEELLNEIKREGEYHYPDECCGFIVGKMEGSGEKTAEEIRRVVNASGERYHRFEIPAEEMMRAERETRRRKKDIIGFYHSHPDCEAVPSEFDRAHAMAVYSYMITSVQKQNAKDIRSWELRAGETGSVFYPEPILIIEKENGSNGSYGFDSYNSARIHKSQVGD